MGGWWAKNILGLAKVGVVCVPRECCSIRLHGVAQCLCEHPVLVLPNVHVLITILPTNQRVCVCVSKSGRLPSSDFVVVDESDVHLCELVPRGTRREGEREKR